MLGKARQTRRVAWVGGCSVSFPAWPGPGLLLSLVPGQPALVVLSRGVCLGRIQDGTGLWKGDRTLPSYTLKDIRAESPGYPTAALERRIHPPCNVKLLFVPDPPEHGYPQAMWVKVTDAANGTYTGALANHPSPSEGLPDYGDPVTFEGRHIITVMPSSE